MYPSQTFSTIQELLTYINTYIVPNGNNEIKGDEHNNVENGLAKFIIQSPRNWNKATVINTAGAYTATNAQCILVFNSAATGSVTLTDNIWNEWTIVNRTVANKALVGAISTFYTPQNTISNYCPSNGVLNLVKGNDNKWYQVLAGTQTGNFLAPLIGVAGGGGSDDPISGTSTYQNDRLIGIGGANSGKFIITIDGLDWQNFGTNATQFTANTTTGEIDISPNQWYDGMSLYVDLNQ